MGGEVKVLPSGEKRILRFAAADKDADRVRRGLSALGDMQVFQRRHQLITRLEAEVDSKIEEIEAEIGRNAGDLAKMPIASVLMKATLDKLRRSKGMCDAARENSVFSIELVPDWESGPSMQAAGPPDAEEPARGNLDAIRYALSIFRSDTGGRYPSDLRELTAGGKYLGSLPPLEVGGHGRTNESRTLWVRDRKDLESKIQDTGRWLYVGDQGSPLVGTIVIDCRHPDRRGTPWHRY